MTARIIDRGRGPEIEGTRITVYDVVDYWRKGWEHDQIAGLFRLPPNDILEAVRFIEQHHDQVMADYQRIVERHRDVHYPPGDHRSRESTVQPARADRVGRRPNSRQPRLCNARRIPAARIPVRPGQYPRYRTTLSAVNGSFQFPWVRGYRPT